MSQPVGILGTHRRIFIGVLGFLTSCVTSQPASQPGPTIEAVKPGDQNLGCTELRNEMAQMDVYIRDGERVEAERQRDAAGNTAGGVAAGYALPMGGLLYNIGVSHPKANEWTMARERAGQAMRRKEQLVVNRRSSLTPSAATSIRLKSNRDCGVLGKSIGFQS